MQTYGSHVNLQYGGSRRCEQWQPADVMESVNTLNMLITVKSISFVSKPAPAAAVADNRSGLGSR